MPVRNEGRFIKESLQAVLAQDYPADKTEIIVADGMSTDGTRETVLGLAEKHPNIFLLDNPSGKTPAALNIAFQKARGEMIVRVDGHAVIAPDYVSRCVTILQSGQADAAGGPIETVGETFMAKAIASAMSSVFGVGNSAFRTSAVRQYADTVPFPAYSREWVEKAGGYDEELVRNQDDEYNYRLRGLGARILLDPGIRSRYYSRSSLVSLVRQYFQYGFWKVRVMQKHPEGMSWRQFVPPAFVFLCFFMALTPFAPGLLKYVLAAYLVFILAGAVTLGIKKGFKYMAVLPFIFAALHFSYGTGFLCGLVSFAPRWFEKKS